MNQPDSPPSPPPSGRYHRQALLREVGAEGQALLGRSHALIVGCGALGTVSAEMLARAGVGALTIVDRDIVELTNLQRQCLYDEADVREGPPKAEAARRRLEEINSQVRVRALVEDVSARNIERIVSGEMSSKERVEVGGVDVIVDGTDNFETRYLLNDVAVKRGIPFVYGAAVGVTGMYMPILPQSAIQRVSAHTEPTPCLRCLFEDPPAPGGAAAAETCDTVGVLGPVVATIANMQAAEAIKILLRHFDALCRTLTSINLWSGDIHQMDVSRARRDDCPCCGLGRMDYLDASSPAGGAVTLCGRNSIQISPAAPDGLLRSGIDLASLASRLSSHGSFVATRFLLKGEFDAERSETGAAVGLTVFPDGRALFTGVAQPQRARALYARYIGA